jgi:hypothetical protein
LKNITFWSGRSGALQDNEYSGQEALGKIMEKYFANEDEEGKKLSEKYLQSRKINYGTTIRVAEIHLGYMDQ